MLNEAEWLGFLNELKAKSKLNETEASELESFINEKKYIKLIEKALNGESFSPPKKLLLDKKGTDKKRIVYVFPTEENYILKMLAFKLKKYDGIFSDRLYSFRCKNGVKEAFSYLKNIESINKMYSYKLDISNYFNSIPIDRMVEVIYNRLYDDLELCKFLEKILTDPFVEEDGKIINEKKGVMAGTPISPFLANLYLADLDEAFEGRYYARYSDDIIVFAEGLEQCDKISNELKQYIFSKGLLINEKKEIQTLENEPWTFLGIEYCNGETDISRISCEKLKAKLHRRARALERWKRHKGATNEQATKAYIRAVNRMLFDNPKHSELTWCRWYFPLISTDKSLKELDHYIQTSIRYVYFGKYNKKSYSLRYEDMKELGYKSLVHEYYDA